MIMNGIWLFIEYLHISEEYSNVYIINKVYRQSRDKCILAYSVSEFNNNPNGVEISGIDGHNLPHTASFERTMDKCKKTGNKNISKASYIVCQGERICPERHPSDD